VPRRLRASRRRAVSREFFSASGGPLERCRLYADRANRRRGSPPNPAVPLHLCPRWEPHRVSLVLPSPFYVSRDSLVYQSVADLAGQGELSAGHGILEAIFLLSVQIR
jgi:hypothetical protein